MGEKGLRLRTKILLGYILAVILPLIFLSVLNYVVRVNILVRKAEEQLGIAGEAIGEQFDNFFLDIDAISNDICNDDKILEILKRSRQEVEKEPFTNVTIQREAELFFMGICSRKPGIDAILLHGRNGLNAYYSPAQSWDLDYDSSGEKWYQDTLAANGKWVLTGSRRELQFLNSGTEEDRRVVTFSRTIKDWDAYGPLGILQINVSVEYLSGLGSSAVGEGNLEVFDGDGEPVFNGGRGENKDVLVIENLSPLTSWKTVYYAPKDQLLKEIDTTRVYTILIAGVSLLVVFAAATVISSGIVRPMKYLHKEMRQVAAGNFDGKILYEKEDEMGDLIREFNSMTQKVKQLVEEIQEKERQRRKTELDALQARINPHFMFNTLNAVRLMAMMDGNERITEMLTSFVYLLKFASKNENELISVGTDLSILESYITLMKYRYDNFTVEICCGEEIRRYLTIPFLLQPLVENAIFHGIAVMDRPGKVSLTFSAGEGKVTAVVSDNGAGMDRQTLERLFEEEQEHTETFSRIGVRNVRERMYLFFGDDAQMEVESEVGSGTRIALTWPAVSEEEKNDECDDCG